MKIERFFGVKDFYLLVLFTFVRNNMQGIAFSLNDFK